jgi:hypothetical protein
MYNNIMKKYVVVFLLTLLFSVRANAQPVWSQDRNSAPSNSQYSPGKNYGFQINWDDPIGISTVIFETNFYGNLQNYTNVNSLSNTYWINFTDLPGGNYVFKWHSNNTNNEFGSTNQFGYIVSKNISGYINLTLNGIEGNKSYNLNTAGNFTAYLNLPGKTIYLDSTFPNWILKSNSSILYNTTNLSSKGLFSLTAYWSGDENYSSSSKTYFFDTIPPQPLDIITVPNSPTGYIRGATYQFKVSWDSATLRNVWFESNHTGSFKNYTLNSTPSVQNSSGVFWITLTDLGSKRFSYRWFANDSLNRVGYTNRTNYDILKMTPLVLNILPSEIITQGTQITATCYSVNPIEVPSSKFTFYRDSTPINNISTTVRMEVSLLSQGTYNYTCNTTGTGNYTNQTITKIITVSGLPITGNVTKEFKITDVGSPTIEAGKEGESSFKLTNTLGKNLVNIKINLTGIPSNWDTVLNKPSSIISGSSITINIKFVIQPDAEAKSYGIIITVKGETAENELKTATQTMNMIVTAPPSPPTNAPPTFFEGSVSATIAGKEALFLAELSDDSGLSGYIFSTNNTGEWKNDSWVTLTGKTGWSNITKTLNSNVGSIIAWKVYANDSNNEWTVSEEYILKTTQAEMEIDVLIPILIVIVVVIAIVAVFIYRRKLKEVLYVYTKEEAELF